MATTKRAPCMLFLFFLLFTLGCTPEVPSVEDLKARGVTSFSRVEIRQPAPGVFSIHAREQDIFFAGFYLLMSGLMLASVIGAFTHHRASRRLKREPGLGILLLAMVAAGALCGYLSARYTATYRAEVDTPRGKVSARESLIFGLTSSEREVDPPRILGLFIVLSEQRGADPIYFRLRLQGGEEVTLFYFRGAGSTLPKLEALRDYLAAQAGWAALPTERRFW
jgi:hypothetical protein